MLARSLLALLAATAAVAIPGPPTAELKAKGFVPAAGAYNALSLALRQNSCPVGYDTCVDACYPLDGSVCCDDGTVGSPAYLADHSTAPAAPCA
jgi:hypothetical protein